MMGARRIGASRYCAGGFLYRIMAALLVGYVVPVPDGRSVDGEDG